MTDPQPASLLRERPFVQFWIARLFTTNAFHMQAVAVGWQMYDLTNDPLDLGLVGLVQFVPSFLLVLVAGHFADRHDRRRIVAIAQAIAGVASLLLTLGTASGVMTRDGILATVLVVGLARAFEGPDPPGAGAGAGAAAAVAARGRRRVGGRPDRHDRRTGDRRLPLCGEPDPRLRGCAARCISSAAP